MSKRKLPPVEICPVCKRPECKRPEIARAHFHENGLSGRGCCLCDVIRACNADAAKQRDARRNEQRARQGSLF